MVEPASDRKLIGNVSLYRHLALRPQPFLRRNLDFVLDQHEKTLAKATDPDRAADALARLEDIVADEKRRSGWGYPTKEMLEDLLKGQKPVLKIDALQLRRQELDAEKKVRSRWPLKLDNQLDWLPSPDVDFSMAVQVIFTFRDISQTPNNQTKLTTEIRNGTILSKELHNDKYRQFDICLEEPYEIEVDKIYVAADVGKNNGHRWKRSVPAQYELRVEINCQDSVDSAKLLSMLEDRTQSRSDQISSKESTIRATWSDLPDCPPHGKLLKLTRTNGHRNIDFAYGIELSMGWNRRRESPLTQYTKLRRKLNEPEKTQLPTPSPSDESERSTASHLITYVFQKTRHHTMDSLKCPFCVVEPVTVCYTHGTFDRLHLHLLTYHNHFRLKVEHGVGEKTGGASPICKTIHLELADKSFERTSLLPDEEEQWIAPPIPFDQSAYLRGEDKWTGHQKVKPQGRMTAKRGRSSTHTPVNGSAPAEQVDATVTTRPSVQDVKDLPPKQKKRHAVPTVPGIRFYRTLSKRLFREGELVAESDDEVDETWLQQRLHDDLSKLGFASAASEFIQDFNAHASEEGFAADVLTREGVVRFARQNRSKGHEWLAEFRKCLKELCRQRIIDKEVVRYCLSLHEPSSREDTNYAMDEVMKDVSATDSPPHQASRKLHTYSTSCATFQKPSSEQRARSCFCEKPVQSVRGSIICDGLLCTRVYFHLHCVGLERREEGWLCSDCSSKDAAPQG